MMIDRDVSGTDAHKYSFLFHMQQKFQSVKKVGLMDKFIKLGTSHLQN